MRSQKLSGKGSGPPQCQQLISQRLPFAKGSYYVDLRQKNANYVISVMERKP